ncbi:MAG: tRNA 2-thiocytidine biosynthesis protein TtcA [Bacilli bacterium]|nr:tRNA 2-thiocytidine biosynthesis protein TtcA [Bacilli bacterium]
MKENEFNKEVEKSIIKKYKKTIWERFTRAINDYKLIEDNDNIMVCISGGKDSFLLAKCIQELMRHRKINFKAKFVVMNPGYRKENIEKIINNSKLLNIDIEIYESDIFAVAEKLNKEKPCYMCARMRRGFLYNKAQELGCNKIALGHHFDDVIETTLLSMFYGAELKTMLPKLHSENFENIELIRPLYLVKEQDILDWKNYNNLEFLNCACSFTEKTNNDVEISKRKDIKKLITSLREKYENIDYNIFKSMDNVNLNSILGYKRKEERHNFLEEYDTIDNK